MITRCLWRWRWVSSSMPNKVGAIGCCAAAGCAPAPGARRVTPVSAPDPAIASGRHPRGASRCAGSSRGSVTPCGPDAPGTRANSCEPESPCDSDAAAIFSAGTSLPALFPVDSGAGISSAAGVSGSGTSPATGSSASAVRPAAGSAGISAGSATPPAGSCPSAGTESCTDSATVSAAAVSQSEKAAPGSATGRPAWGAMNPDSGSRPGSGERRQFGFRHGQRLDRKHFAQVKADRDLRREGFLPDGIGRSGCLLRTETHGLVECPQFIECEIPLEGADLLGLIPAFNNFRELAQFAPHVFQIHNPHTFCLQR